MVISMLGAPVNGGVQHQRDGQLHLCREAPECPTGATCEITSTENRPGDDFNGISNRFRALSSENGLEGARGFACGLHAVGISPCRKAIESPSADRWRSSGS